MELTDLQRIQSEMMKHLLGEASDIQPEILDEGNLSAEQRLSIYHNAYRARLIETIETDHEILGLYLGDELFDKMARGYIGEHRSTNTSLRYFCDALPAYLRQHAPFNQHPEIAELARFERLLLAAFDAGDTATFSRQDLAQIPAEKWPGMQLRLHPSVQVFKTATNAVPIWQALKNNRVPETAALSDQYWLLWRNHERLTEFRFLPADEANLMELTLEGKNFADLCEHLATFHESDNTAEQAVTILWRWIDAGIIRDIAS